MIIYRLCAYNENIFTWNSEVQNFCDFIMKCIVILRYPMKDVLHILTYVCYKAILQRNALVINSNEVFKKLHHIVKFICCNFTVM